VVSVFPLFLASSDGHSCTDGECGQAKGFLQNRLRLAALDQDFAVGCLVCQRKFLGWFSEKYCSEDCRIEGRQVKDRLRQRKGRKIIERKEGLLGQELGELGLGDRSYPMYNHELVPSMFANPSLYHGRDGRRHVRSYYDLIREIAKLNGVNGFRELLSALAPEGE